MSRIEVRAQGRAPWWIVWCAVGAATSAVAQTSGPVISSLSPASVAVGGPATVLTVNGSGFTAGSIVKWNYNPVPTTFVNTTQLVATLAPESIAIAGRAIVAVVTENHYASPPAQLTISGSIPSNVSFVAGYGNDSGPGTLDQPYFTIQKCATTVSSGATCAVRRGSYYETVTPNSGITITSYDGETVTVDGTDAVSGWSQYQGNVYAATVNMSSGDTNQVFVNGAMMTEARWPNGNDLFHVNWATLQSGTTATQVVDPNLPNIDWTGAKVHFWSGSDPWDHQTGTVTTSQSGQLTFSPDGAPFCPYICAQPGGFYYLYGILGALDAPQEWAYVPTTNTLYLWAPGNVNPASRSVRIKQRPYAFDLSGRSNVTIQNINLFATSINSDAASTNNVINAINAQYVSHFTTLPDQNGMSLSSWNDHVTDSGIILNGSGNVLENSTISYSAGNGVSVVGNGNTVANNLIHHVDYIGNYTAGVSLTGGNHEIQNNTIYASGRSAVWPSYAATAPDDISYNNFFDGMMLSADGAEIYVSYPGPSGSTIHHNWLHDTQALVPGVVANFALSGVYLDEDASGYQVYQNVMWNDAMISVFVNGSTNGVTVANDNIIQDNSIPDVNSNSYIWFGGIPIQTCGTAQVADNFVLVPAVDSNTPACTFIDNSAAAPGATDMAGVSVGCNFSGCSSNGPPTVVGNSVATSIAVQPYGITVPVGQSATFSVVGAGSPPLTYQWFENGEIVAGATSSVLTTPPTVASDNGAQFTVQVGNGFSTVTSTGASLTVQ